MRLNWNFASIKLKTALKYNADKNKYNNNIYWKIILTDNVTYLTAYVKNGYFQQLSPYIKMIYFALGIILSQNKLTYLNDE